MALVCILSDFLIFFHSLSFGLFAFSSLHFSDPFSLSCASCILLYYDLVPIWVQRDQPNPVTPCRRVGVKKARVSHFQSAILSSAFWLCFSFWFRLLSSSSAYTYISLVFLASNLFFSFRFIFAVLALAYNTVVTYMGIWVLRDQPNPVTPCRRVGVKKRVCFPLPVGYILGCLLVVFFSFSWTASFPPSQSPSGGRSS